MHGSLLRKLIFLFVGIGLILLGIILMPLPGPGLLILFAGVWLIGEEFETARRWRRKLGLRIKQGIRNALDRRRRPPR